MKALILAGGKGARLRPLTMHTPKPIVPIANRPLLHYQIELLKKAGISDLIVSLSKQHWKIEDRLIDGSDLDVRISYTTEASPLGTAGAFKNASDLINETTVVINGDILTDVNLAEVVKYHKQKEAIATIVIIPVENPQDYGFVKTDAKGRVIKYMEKPSRELIDANTINAGIYVLEPKVLEYVSAAESMMFEYGVFPSLIEQKEPFYGYKWKGYWADIGTPAAYRQANLDVLAGKINLFQPHKQDVGEKFDKKAEIDSTSIVDTSCVLKGSAQIINSIIARNCFIEEKARIENSVIRAGSRIGTSAVVRDSVVGKGCHIGRYVSISRGSILGDKSVLTDHSTVSEE